MTELIPIFTSSFARAPWGWALLGAVLLGLIKIWPVIQLQVQQAREKLRSETRTDLSDCKARIDSLQQQLEVVKTTVHNLEMKLVGAISAYRILDAEVESRLPGSTALAQARLVMSTAFTMSPSTAEDFFNSAGKSDTLKAAENTAESAHVTCDDADEAVRQVKADEEKRTE